MGDIIRLRIASAASVPHPSSVEVMKLRPDEDGHSGCMRLLRLWSITAERLCGARWCRRVIQTQLAYFDARVAMGADIGRKP